MRMRGECASRSPIRRKPSSGECGAGGRPRSTSASGGGASSWRRSWIACRRDSQAYTTYSVPRAKASVSVMSGSSSTTSSAGFSLGDACGLVIADAFEEGALEVALGVALAQRAGAAAKAHAPALEHADRRAQLLHVGEHVRGEKER